MAEAVAGDMVVAHLGDQLGPQRLPVADRSVLQRLGPPGASPVKPGGSTSVSSLAVSAGRSAAGIAEVKPTWLSLPASS